LVIHNKKTSREDAKAQRNDYHVSVFLRAFASSREKILSVRALMAGNGLSCDLAWFDSLSVTTILGRSLIAESRCNLNDKIRAE